jgi:SAM-dependent methyltransferase
VAFGLQGRTRLTPRPDPTERFSDRVADYVRARPGYPDAIVAALARAFGMSAGRTIADVGAGTGIATELFLRHGMTVAAVEPNDAMRAALDGRLGGRPGFASVAGTAESTTLAGASVDAVVAAQAFHWFDRKRFRAECLRILKPDGIVALIWNVRSVESSEFGRDYERLLREHAVDYLKVRHEEVSDADIDAFFGNPPRRWSFENRQELDFGGLRARLVSSSYTPANDDPRRAPMLAALRAIFDAHADRGRVVMEYSCGVHAGRLAS